MERGPSSVGSPPPAHFTVTLTHAKWPLLLFSAVKYRRIKSVYQGSKKVLNTALKEMPPIPGLENTCRKAALLQVFGTGTHQSVQEHRGQPPNTQGPWQSSPSCTSAPSLMGIQGLPFFFFFFKSHDNVVRFKRYNASEKVLRKLLSSIEIPVVITGKEP